MFFTFLLLTQYLIGFSQFFDDFSDGNFTSNPNWIGDLGVFEVDTSYKLHLIDSASNTTYLSTTSHAVINGSWQFDVKMDFSPSTSNYSKVYLISNSQNLDSNLNGYYVKIGGQSGDIDDVSLHVQNGSSSTEIIDGTDGITASNPDLTVKVTRDDLGNWALFVDTSNTYFSEGIAYDTTHLSADYFGIYCKYTSTRADKFWFDNFNISGTFISDTTKPFVQSFFVTSSNSILINFSENINSTTALNTNNYTTSNGIGNPNSITVVSPKSIELFFSNSFVSPNNYQLSINNLEDLSQNIMPPFDTTFSYFIAKENDIIINEIFADPTPSIGLPGYEYIELYNTTNSALDLTDWTLTVGTTDKVFPTSIIEADSFVILIKDAVIDSFPNNISKIGFSSISLTNGGASISLKNTSDSIINLVTFTDNWYNDSDKDDGGWSLELINPNALCLKKDNWSASNNLLGGTPGRKNSIFSNQNNLDSLYITNVFASGVYNVIVEFSRGIDSLQLANTSNYFISNLGTPNSVAVSNNNETISLAFSDSLLPGINYILQIQNILSDCLGNSIDTTLQYNFIPPFSATINEVVINEVFADPDPSIGLPESEYIELYNNTNKLFSLNGWKLIIGGSEKDFSDAVIEPDSFVLLLKEDDIDLFPSNISKIGFSSISLTNGGGDIILEDSNGIVISAISYTDKWYNDDTKSAGGWSIERVNPDLFCEEQNNWRASVSNIGGTPGKQNSVFGENVFSADFRITKAYLIASNKVKIHLNKSADSLLLSDSSYFEINNISAIKSEPIAPFFDASILTFNFNFLDNKTYAISANELTDCSGNVISNAVQFGILDSALSNDIIINEVLFNPKDDGVDYVELFNNSNSFFDLSKLRIANFFEFGEILNPENSKIITEEALLFSPHTYLVLTTDSAKIKEQYDCEAPYNFIEVASMPTLSNDSGTICIIHQSQNQIIDAFAYYEDMHFSLLETADGVSLERLNPNAETQNSNNWHSAASTVGFGTPTYKNSQELITQSIGELTVSPKSFTPNNDGHKDVCAINWVFSKNNLTATIKIFDSEGRGVKNILNNKMIGNSGNISWDGTSEDGLQLNTGMYIVWMEVFSENGNVERFKKVVVLSR